MEQKRARLHYLGKLVSRAWADLRERDLAAIGSNLALGVGATILVFWGTGRATDATMDATVQGLVSLGLGCIVLFLLRVLLAAPAIDRGQEAAIRELEGALKSQSDAVRLRALHLVDLIEQICAGSRPPDPMEAVKVDEKDKRRIEEAVGWFHAALGEMPPGKEKTSLLSLARSADKAFEGGARNPLAVLYRLAGRIRDQLGADHPTGHGGA